MQTSSIIIRPIIVLILLLNSATQADRGSSIGCFRKNLDNVNIYLKAGTVDKCLDSCSQLFYKYAVLFGSSCSCTNSFSAEKVNSTICNTPCQEDTEQFCGGEDTESYYETDIRVAGPVTNVVFENITDVIISVSWTPPETSALLESYMIRAEVVITYSLTALINPEWVVGRDERHFDMVNLHPGTKYNVTIISMGSSGKLGGSISLEEWTTIGEPDIEPPEPKILSASETTQIVEINPVLNNNGPVSKYHVVVNFITFGLLQEFDLNLLKDYHASREDGTQYYIAAELQLDNFTRRFLLGDGRTVNGYYNAPLPPKSHVHVALGVVSTLNNVTKRRYGSSSHDQHDHLDLFDLDEDGNSVMIIVLSVCCVILALLLVASVFMFLYVRKKAKSPRRRLTDQHELTPQGPVHEMENNGFVGDELDRGTFKQQLKAIFDRIPAHEKLARNALSLDIDNILGTGRFGDVIHGSLHRTNSSPINCQIHVISDDMERPDQVLFLKEFDQLLRVTPHNLLLPFFGVCTTADWLYIIFEDTGMSLKQLLVQSRLPMNVDPHRLSTLTEEFVLRVICSVSDAMEYLSNHLIVHKQLCSYNISMATNDEPKLNIFGPTLYIEDRKLVDLARYHAPEVLRYQHHTSRSDVWSFACLAWESCTLGGTLYSNITSVDLLSRIKNGARPEQTPFIYNDLYQLLLNCWELDPVDRLDFKDLSLSLRQLLNTSPKHVLLFDRTDGLTLPYYLPLLEIKNFE